MSAISVPSINQTAPLVGPAASNLSCRQGQPEINAQTTDEQLVLRVRQGDTDAFAELTNRHRATCLKRASMILGNRSDAEDQVQGAFAKALGFLDQFRFEGPFSAWLCRIVQNECLMLMRERRQAELVRVDVIADSKVRLELVDQLIDQEDGIGSDEVMKLLLREISRIPPLMRNVILLRDIQELPLSEVAARLDLTVPAAKSRLMRARKELRRRIVKYCGRSGPRTLLAKPIRKKIEHVYVS